MRKIEKLKRLSLLGMGYKNATFENSKTGIDSSFYKAFKRCHKYCELYEETIKNGYGIYLFGDKGVGKTHLTICMANNLISKCVLVMFTNLFEISKSLLLKKQLTEYRKWQADRLWKSKVQVWEILRKTAYFEVISID